MSDLEEGGPGPGPDALQGPLKRTIEVFLHETWQYLQDTFYNPDHMMCFLKAINNILHGHNHKTPMTKCTHLIHSSIIKEHLEGTGDTSDDARIEI